MDFNTKTTASSLQNGAIPSINQPPPFLTNPFARTGPKGRKWDGTCGWEPKHKNYCSRQPPPTPPQLTSLLRKYAYVTHSKRLQVGASVFLLRYIYIYLP
jgi:hypothetical protein